MRKYFLIATTCIAIISNGQVSDSLRRVDLTRPMPLPQTITPSNWPTSNIATCNYGFFCKQELKADKKTPIPVRMRLGSKEMTDWLESKPGANRVGN